MYHKLIFLLLFTSAIFAQSGKSVLTQAQKDSINDIIERYINDSTLVDDIISDSTVLKHRYSGSAYSSKDTIIFGGSSLTPFYNRGVVGALSSGLQGRFQIKEGLNILPDASGYGKLNIYQGNSSNRGMGLINFQSYNTTKSRYETLYQMGVDVAAPLTSDGLPPVFILFNARDTSNIANDLFGAVGHNYTREDGGKRYRGQFMINSMSLNAVLSIATHQTYHPASLPLLQLHRSALSADSTNDWLRFTWGSGGLGTVIWSDSTSATSTNSITWFNRRTASFSYLNGDGYKFQFSNNNNELEMQGGKLTFKGGTFYAIPNRIDWDNPSIQLQLNNTATNPFDNNSGLRLFNSNNTVNAYSQIYNTNVNSVVNSSINFVNVDQTSKGAITFNTKDTDTQGERVRITEGGHLILKALETDVSSSQMTVNDVAIYLKDDKLKIAYLIDGGVRTKSLNLVNSDSVFQIEDTLGTELLDDKSFESFTGTANDGTSDDWTYFGETATSGIVEAVTGKFNYAIKMTNNTGSAFSGLNIFQTGRTVTAETNYRFTFYTKGDGTNAGYYRLRDATNSADIISSTTTGITVNEWTQKTVDFTTPAGCVQIIVYLYGNGTNGSVIYFDSASLREIQ